MYELLVRPYESAIHTGRMPVRMERSAVHEGESFVQPGQSLVQMYESLVHAGEPLVHLGEALPLKGGVTSPPVPGSSPLGERRLPMRSG